MRLRRVADSFLALVLVALVVNLGLLLLVRQAIDTTTSAVARRDTAHDLVDQLVQETDLLSHLVQSYTTTGKVSYLTTYYDMLAVRQGEKPAPVSSDAATYWREVVAGRRSAALPAHGDRRNLIERLRGEAFSAAELQAAQAVLTATEPMQAIEKVAFAATQGLYDGRTRSFVSDGEPDLKLAVELVHSPVYESHRADLVSAVQHLAQTVGQRTRDEVAQAKHRLDQAITATLVVNALLLPLYLGAARVIHRQVLRPIRGLVGLARRFAAGDFSQRARPADGAPVAAGVDELDTLASTLDSMAQAIAHDLHQRDVAQRELAQARDQAQAAAQTKGMFLANMSHEIRTPMNAIMGMTQLALRTELDAQQRDYLDKALGASHHLLALINDVLDFSKIEAGGMTLEAAPFALETVLAQAIGLVRQRAQDKELELLCDVVDPALLAGRGRLVGDAVRLSQVLTNLLGNAVKFTPAGQVLLSVDTEDPVPHAADAPVDLVITVRDTGIGMSPAQCEALFQEFVQADLSTTRRFGGTGLGLAISKRLVDLMGGRIEVHSQPGQGTTFQLHLRLPQAAAEAPDSEAAGLPEAARLQVLVVDDQRDTLVTVQALLQRLGVGSQGGVAAARDGREALQRLQQARQAGQPVDLLLLDWVLPDLDGAELMRRARAEQPGLRVVVMTAYNSPQVRSHARAAGHVEVIDKPVLPDDLRRLFRHAPADTPAPGHDIRLDGLRLLLVEDNALNRQLAVELLQGQGAQVQLAVNGLEALARLRADGPQAHDLVLMDLQMPVMDGYEAVRQLRRLPEFDALPVLAMTANAMAGERERCLAGGMQGHIPKPLDAHQLFALLQPYVRARQGDDTPQRAVPDLGVAAMPGEPASALPTIAGVDSARLLAHCAGNVSLARRLLAGFASDHAEGVAAWARWIDRNEHAELQRAAHTLRGLAGTLGAQALRLEAERLEQLAGQDETGSQALHQQLTRLDQSLAVLLNALARERGALSTPPAPQAPARAPDASTPLPDLTELARLLQDSDSQALGWWQAHSAALQAHLNPVALRRIGAAMARFDFDVALQALQALGRGHDATPPELPVPDELPESRP